jgi:glycosyltransferase involved in cell wall biosynthesis
MPALNAEQTLAAAVDSVLGQKGIDLELIAIDDGSTDATFAKLTAVGDPRLKVLTEPNAGPATARNRGVAAASGDLIAFIDADDVWLPGKAVLLAAALNRRPASALAYCWTEHIDEDGRYLCTDRHVRFAGDVYEDMLTHNFIDTVSAVVLRKSAFEAVGGFDESLLVAEDWDLYLRLAATVPFVCVPEVLTQYRRSPTSLSSDVLVMESAARRVIDRAFSVAPDELQHLKRRTIARFYEYLLTRASQGRPSRRNGRLVWRFFRDSLRSWPLHVLTVWRRPWVLRALGQGLAWRVAPRS